jgi:hypothetical protein
MEVAKYIPPWSARLRILEAVILFYCYFTWCEDKRALAYFDVCLERLRFHFIAILLVVVMVCGMRMMGGGRGAVLILVFGCIFLIDC